MDADVTARLANAQGKTLAVLIELVGQRRIDATGNLIRRLDHPDEAVRSAALTSLGATISPQELSTLISQAINPTNAADTKVAQRAPCEACLRMPDRETCAGQVAAALPRVDSDPSKPAGNFGRHGWDQRPWRLSGSMKNNDAQIQDTGSRVLGEWMTADAGPVLLDLAKSAPEDKYRVLRCVATSELLGNSPMPYRQRAEMCQNAAHRRQPDRRAEAGLGSVVGVIPTILCGRRQSDTSARIPRREDAARTTLVIVQKLGGEGAKTGENCSPRPAWIP